MKLATLGKFWLALLLLVSSLGSTPVGSMQQGAPDVIGSTVYGPSLPFGRSGAHDQRRSALAEPTARGSWRSDPQLPTTLAASGTLDRPATLVQSGAPHPPRPQGGTPHCERLPYHANAPPA
jgi:hypothetical protein